MTASARRRAFGQYFTPAWLARQIVADAIAALPVDTRNAAQPGNSLSRSPSSHTQSRPLRLLDPAAGEGAFLLAAMEVCDAHSVDVDIAGCEIDAEVLSECHRQPQLRVDRRGIRVRLVHGNAVTGPDWSASPVATNTPVSLSTASSVLDTQATTGDEDAATAAAVSAMAINWSAAFPDVASAGGFDLVVGNPPFVRELGSKQLLAGVAAADWCVPYRQPRMDLSQYFVHRALNLLRADGVLAFILPEYWLAGSSGRRLRRRLATECTLQQIVLLGKWPIFAGVSGRHVVLQVRKTPAAVAATCLIRTIIEPATNQTAIDRSTSQNRSDESSALNSVAANDTRVTPDLLINTVPDLWCNRACNSKRLAVEDVVSADGGPWNLYGSQTELRPHNVAAFDFNKANLNSESQSLPTPLHSPLLTPLRSLDGAESWASGCVELATLFDVRQGIAENPPVVTKAMANEAVQWNAPSESPSNTPANDRSGVMLGAGVFVLTSKEVAALELDPNEMRLLRPYYLPREFYPFAPPVEPQRWLLYLTEAAAPDITALPQIFQHLARFKHWLDRRREVQRGRIAWWHLHWPRQERLFVEPRIVGLQMSREPTFAWMTAAGFVGFSCHVIAPKRCIMSTGVATSAYATRSPEVNQAPPATFSLQALTGLLNSDFAAGWFERNAKKRGIRWDISGGVLRSFPLPPFDFSHNARLSRLVEKLQTINTLEPRPVGLSRDWQAAESHRDGMPPPCEMRPFCRENIDSDPPSDERVPLRFVQHGDTKRPESTVELQSEISQVVDAWYAQAAKMILR